MKIALIQCPVWGTYDPPLALAQLFSCLKVDKHEVFALDLNIELCSSRKQNHKDIWAWEQCGFWYNPEHVSRFFEDNQSMINEHVNKILSVNPQIICFSVSSSSRLASLELARLIKKEAKDKVIVFGGTLFFEQRWINSLLDEDAVDIVAYGEGEITLCELASLLEKNKPLDSCLGISFKKCGKVFNNPPRPFIKNLDSLPFMDFSCLPIEKYDDIYHIPFLTSRGCVLQCVFCSSRSFWPGYRRMSGKRIFDEIAFQKDKNNTLGHIDFLDLMFNGDIRELTSFCDLMINWDLKSEISWIANAIVRPEMTPGLFKRMKAAGCKHLLFGIESGSQRVLDGMKKRFKIEDADRVIKDAYEAGIVVTANFMFGFPGEEDADFAKTLDFIRRNAKYLGRVYPSRTFFAIEEFSYLHAHPQEFGIKPNPPNHLYWESIDGANTYPERLNRCEEFCQLATSLGIEVACGLQTSVELDRWFNLSAYYESKRDIKNSLDCYLRYYELEPNNEMISQKIINYFDELSGRGANDIINSGFGSRLKRTVDLIKFRDKTETLPEKNLGKVGRGRKSIALSKNEQKDNIQLNEAEFNNRETMLHSTPRVFFLQASGPCNSNCVFCSRGTDYEMFDLEIFRERFEEKLQNELTKAEQIVLTGSGEFLLLPEAEKILDYFDYYFPHVNKMFSTNGASLTPRICEKITASDSKYTIHVSLHAANSQLHKALTRTDNFHKILGQINYLFKLRKETGNPRVHLIFVATTLNIEDLPNFIDLASSLGVDKVVCYYNYIYVEAQKYLSCFFKQELTNRILSESEELAKRLGIPADFPPKFGLANYPKINVCKEPWAQIMVNLKGHVLPCDASEDCSDNLRSVRWFADIWNSQYYRNLRQSLLNGTNSCFKYCFRANPQAVNDFRSHVIRRGRKESEIDILWGDVFNIKERF